MRIMNNTIHIYAITNMFSLTFLHHPGNIHPSIKMNTRNPGECTRFGMFDETDVIDRMKLFEECGDGDGSGQGRKADDGDGG